MTTQSRLADRFTALAGSVDLSGFTPFLSPLMFFLNENLWPTMTLMVSLAAILLTTFVMVGWRRGRVQVDGNRVIAAPHKAPGFNPVTVQARLSLSIPGYAGFPGDPSPGIRDS